MRAIRSQRETKVFLEDGLTADGKPLKHTYEALELGKAYDYMFTALHNLFYQQIDGANAGVWRKQPIFVSGTDYVFPAPEKLDERMNALGEWADGERDKYHTAEFSALLHLKFVTIHPFKDDNGRTSRLLSISVVKCFSNYIL